MRSLPITLTSGVLAAALAPAAAMAQAPSYAAGETIHGTISAVRDLTHLVVDDDRGYIDNVTLRSNAAVVPDGVRLEPGQRVTIDGAASGPTFLATQIATSGRSADYRAAVSQYYPAPVAYYPAPVFYPAPYFYRAPSIGLFFHFR